MACTTNAGTALYYEVAGTGPAVVLLHGRAGNGANWWRQVAHLARHYRVVTPDQRGFARSPCADAAFDPACFAGDVAAVMDDAGVDRAAIVAQSMGGIAGMALARSRPERVAGLFACATLAGISTPEIRAARRTFEADNPPPGLPERAFAPGYRTREPALYALYAQLMTFNRGFDRRWERRLRDPAHVLGPDDFAGYAVPTRFLAGTADQFHPPEIVRAAAALVPGADIVELDGVGHSAYWEAPDRFHALLDDWLAHLSY